MASSNALEEQVSDQPGDGRVLSIQSHTVRGYVGNKAAVFPLQLLGFDVDPINSVQYSNHTGYRSWRGEVSTGDQLWAFLEGLEGNGLLFYTHLLTGYIGSFEFLEVVIRVLERLRAVNPNLQFVCDPVMGDNGKLYVEPSLVPLYRDKVIREASMLTPNQFEAEQLTGLRILTEEDAVKACNALHAAGPRQVIITSLHFGGDIVILGSSCQNKEIVSRFRIGVPRLPQYFTGTGDLMAALLLGWTHKYPNNLPRAAELAVATVQAVLKRTLHHESLFNNHNTPCIELQLVQSREDIISPPIVFRASELRDEGYAGLT